MDWWVGVVVSGLGVTLEVLDWSRGETWMVCAGSSCGCYGVMEIK